MSLQFWQQLARWFGYLSLFAVLALTILLAQIEIKDLDLWLHLAAGGHILQTGTIPAQDIFSFTVAGAPWINHEWLFQLLLRSVYEIAGFEGLLQMQVGLALVTVMVLFFFAYEKSRLLLTSTLLLLFLMTYQMRFLLRPDLVSLLLMSIQFYLMAFHLERRRTVIALVFLQVIWANCHGFYILGPLIAALGLAGESLKRFVPLPWNWNRAGQLTGREYRHLCILFPALLLAGFLTPSGWEGFLYPFRVVAESSGGGQLFFEHIVELESPIQSGNWWNLRVYPYFKILLLLSGLSFFIRPKRVNLTALLIWGTFCALSLSAARNVAYFAVVAYIITHIHLEGVHPRRWFVRRRAFDRVLSKCLVAGSVVFLVFSGRVARDAMLRGYFDFDTMTRKSELGGVSLRNFPHQAVNFMEEAGLRGRFFNDFNSGAYLLGRRFPDHKVYIDGRTEVYGSRFFEEYHRIWTGDTELFEEQADRYQFTGVFLNAAFKPPPPDLMRYLFEHPEWGLVYLDYDGVIFLKRIPPNGPYLARLEKSFSDYKSPVLPLQEIGVKNITPYRHVHRAEIFYNMGLHEQARAEIDVALNIKPNDLDALVVAALLDLDDKRYSEALRVLRHAKLLSPGNTRVRYLISRVFYQMDFSELAREQGEYALQYNPGNTRILFHMARVYARLGQTGAALEVFRRGWETDPFREDEAREVLSLLREQGAGDAARELETWVSAAEQTEIGEVPVNSDEPPTRERN